MQVLAAQTVCSLYGGPPTNAPHSRSDMTIESPVAESGVVRVIWLGNAGGVGQSCVGIALSSVLRQKLCWVATDDYANPDMFEPAFTAPAFSREPCSCEQSVFICRPCGNSLYSADTTYMRGWTWRTRYSTYLGGLGTGIGEGNEGVECGRGDSCLAAKEVEKEIDCDAEELADLKREIEQVEKQGQEGRRWGGTSYLTQEIEGIGGVVKKKVKKRIRVGAVVKEYEDERETGECLERERVGKNRSWCSWCCRVVVGVKDDASLVNGAVLRLTASSSSSEKSCK